LPSLRDSQNSATSKSASAVNLSPWFWFTQHTAARLSSKSNTVRSLADDLQSLRLQPDSPLLSLFVFFVPFVVSLPFPLRYARHLCVSAHESNVLRWPPRRDWQILPLLNIIGKRIRRDLSGFQKTVNA